MMDYKPGSSPTCYCSMFAEIKRLKSFLVKCTALLQIVEEGKIRDGIGQDLPPVYACELYLIQRCVTGKKI